MSSTDVAAIMERLAALEVRVGIGHNAGPPLEDPPADLVSETRDIRLPAAAVAKRYGVVVRTVDRWLTNPDLGFPKPEVLNHRRYFWLSKLRNWDRTRLDASLTKNPGRP